MEFSHRGMVSGTAFLSSRVEFEAKREPRRSAFSFALWTKAPSGFCSGVEDDRQKLPSADLASDQNARLPEWKLASRSPILSTNSYFALAIAFLLAFKAALRFRFATEVLGSLLALAVAQASYAVFFVNNLRARPIKPRLFPSADSHQRVRDETFHTHQYHISDSSCTCVRIVCCKAELPPRVRRVEFW